MHYNLPIYFITSLLLSAVTQFVFFKLSHRHSLFIDDHKSDQPQKFHRSPTPRIGGVGIFIACCLFCFSGKMSFLVLFCGLPAFLAGLIEDVYLNLSPNKRLLIMIASGILPAILLNAVVTNFGLFSVNYPCGVFISFVAILGLINGTNMIDGFNGLLAGTSLIIFGSFAYMSYLFYDTELLLINGIIIAALIGFLFFNYPKGKIFLGDGGAYLLGFFMAVIALLLSKRHQEINPFFVLVCISYPVMEVVFSFVRKGITEHISPFQPDRSHLHMLVNRYVVKHSNPKTILVFAPVILIYNIVAINYYDNQLVLLLLVISFVALYLFSYFFLSKRQEKFQDVS
jgi:UDP-GlcNAc:undecaprenyl-phosphate GlcNAc-1-phosphate transferase